MHPSPVPPSSMHTYGASRGFWLSDACMPALALTIHKFLYTNSNPRKLRNAHLQAAANNIHCAPVNDRRALLAVLLILGLAPLGMQRLLVADAAQRVGEVLLSAWAQLGQLTLTIMSGVLMPSTRPGGLAEAGCTSVECTASIFEVMSSTSELMYFGVTASTPCSK